jgi:hypothetical protein
LPDHPFVQAAFHPQQLLHLAFHQPGDRNTCPARHDLSDFFCVHFFFQQGAFI